MHRSKPFDTLIVFLRLFLEKVNFEKKVSRRHRKHEKKIPSIKRDNQLSQLIINIIIPHVNSPYKTSMDERLIFYNITRCYSNSEYRHVFAIAAGDIIKYQGGHMMRNADARTVRSRQETFNSNGGHKT